VPGPFGFEWTLDVTQEVLGGQQIMAVPYLKFLKWFGVTEDDWKKFVEWANQAQQLARRKAADTLRKMAEITKKFKGSEVTAKIHAGGKITAGTKTTVEVDAWIEIEGKMTAEDGAELEKLLADLIEPGCPTTQPTQPTQP
jgi:hypothetical protein